MKKKILLLIAMVSILICVFAISVSAETEICDFTDVTDVSTIISIDDLATCVQEDNTSRVLLKDENGNYATYLSKYITTIAGDARFQPYFEALNEATGKNYGLSSIVCIEIPNGIKGINIAASSIGSWTNALYLKAPASLEMSEGNLYKSNTSIKMVDYSLVSFDKLEKTGLIANSQSIEVVILPVGLVSMGKTPFHNATNLKKVYFPSTFTTTGSIINGNTRKCAFFYTGDMETAMSVFPSTLPTSISVTLEYVEWDTAKSDDYYVELAQNHKDKNVIYIVCNYNECNAFFGGKHVEKTQDNNPCILADCENCNIKNLYVGNESTHSETTKVVYENYDKAGSKIVYCTNEGCTHSVTTEVPALFICLGYSAPEDGRGGIAIGFTVNNVAIAEYEEVTGKTLKYGVFAVLQNRLGDNDVFADDGTVAEGVINAEITNYEFVAFELKIVGFTDTQKDIKLAMGAYVAVTDGEITEYSYMQGGTPNENEKYCFVSYNDIVGAPSTDEEVTQ